MAEKDIEKKEEKKVEPLKSTSDEIKLDADDLSEIIAKSNAEYNEINDNASRKSSLPVTLLLVGIMILAILIFKTIVKTKDVVEEKSNTSQSYTLTVDDNGETVESHQNIPKDSK